MIPVSEPHFTDNDIKLVNECLLSGWVTTGDYIPKFERAWADYCGRKHGVAVANGTVALELALELLDLKPGEEVIIPSFTIISCALAVIRAGGVPVLVDCDDTWCLDPALVEAAVTPKTRAIMAVHIYGLPVAFERLQKLAASKGVPIIEDAAEGHGAAFLGKRCGSLGLLSCFSFYGNKIITTGEGGMILTDNDNLADRLRSNRNLCFGYGQDRFQHTGLGHNYRLTNIQAAIGYSQTQRIQDIVNHKRLIGTRYRQNLSEHPFITLQEEPPEAYPVYWMNGILVPDPKLLAKQLAQEGIDTRPFFTGLHRQTALKNLTNHIVKVQEDDKTWLPYYPKTDHLTDHGLYLPSGHTLTLAQVDWICQKVLQKLMDHSMPIYSTTSIPSPTILPNS